MSQRARPLPSSLTGPFRTTTALDLGVSRGRLRAADLSAPFHGVRAPAPVTREVDDDAPLAIDEALRADILERVGAHRLVLPAHAFYIGSTARAIYRLPLESPPTDLEVGVLAPHRGLRRPGIAATQVRPELVTIRYVGGIPVASPASVWALSARDATVRDLVVLGDAIVRIPRDERGRRMPWAQLASIDQLAAALVAGRRLGADRLREALARIRVGSASPLETDFRLLIVHAGLPEPDLDAEVRRPDGRLLGISDAVYPDQRIAMEVEGDHHRTSRRQWNRDIQKYADYAAAGWDVVRVTAAHVRGPERDGVGLVRAALERRSRG